MESVPEDPLANWDPCDPDVPEATIAEVVESVRPALPLGPDPATVPGPIDPASGVVAAAPACKAGAPGRRVDEQATNAMERSSAAKNGAILR